MGYISPTPFLFVGSKLRPPIFSTTAAATDMSLSFSPVDFHADFHHIIGGQKVTSPSTAEVINPATGQPFAQVPLATREQLDQCIDEAAAAFSGWAATPLSERQKRVFELGSALLHFKSEFASLLTREQGKPIGFGPSQAGWEVTGTGLWMQGISAQSLSDEVIEQDHHQLVTHHQPLGVCAGIVPWNYPILLMCMKIAPALVTGNVIIIKPSPFTPLCALKFVELAQQILPPGVLSVLSGEDDLGPWMTSHKGIARIAFTGSCATGKKVLESSASTLKRVTLELGGNDCAIVCPDVDVKKTVPDLFWAACQNSGQLCVASKRIYVHDDVYDALRDEFVAFAKTIKLGDGSDPETQLGPIQNKRQYEKVKAYIDDCKSRGLSLALSGDIGENQAGYFVPITVLDNPPEDCPVVVEEQFGPIVPLLKWSDEAEVIKRANHTDYGLGASVWGTDLERATRIAQQLDAGMIWINETMRLDPRSPIGGHKQSGLGVEGSIAGLAEWTTTRVIIRPKPAVMNGDAHA